MADIHARKHSRPMEARAVVSGALGSALEYFDFAVYGALAATLFPTLFFHELGSTGALLASFATFGVGFVARPVGAIVFGHLGDRIGRKPILFATLLLMGGSSILIGLLPTGHGFGIAALLVGLRFIQGFSLGGEAIGNQLMTMEHGDKSRRGLLGAFIIMGSPISQVLANLVLVVLSTTLTDNQFETWGWRVPFLGSIIIVVVAVFIRLKIEETPAFVANKDIDLRVEKRRSAGLRVLATHPRQVSLLTLAWGGSSLSFYLIAVYGLSYLPKETGMSSQTAFVILMVANGASIFFALAGGFVCDRIGRKPVFLFGLTGCFVGITLFFTAAGSNPVTTGLIVTLVLCSIQFLSGAQPALFAEQFPTEVRFSGAAMSHTFSNLIFSAPSPFIAAALAAVGGTNLVMVFTLCVIIGSAVAVSKLQEGRHLDLADFTSDKKPQPQQSDAGTITSGRS
ncbi:MFS transporter [Rhodococcus sp. T2V]|uniref:MFS transporter n=1 Tax=Rhodococcus sp. T2V TaxID=3034164 RepID=UPI0023E2E8A2|nr:MFS transporter [Rhodococcus sp. T2V]MDF3311223.1 MFS transporter [Rhodococcus sp. T2V]